MPQHLVPYRFLVVEDNAGDRLLIEEFLRAHFAMLEIVWATSFVEFQQDVLRCANFDAILLDLSLPDHQGKSLIIDALYLAQQTPVIVLTGYDDFDFAMASMALGISDYLLKEELHEEGLHKSILYSIERKKHLLELQASEQRYSDLFQLSPQPAWCIHPQTQQFLEVNAAAISHYGYSNSEFLAMHLGDLRDNRCIEQSNANSQGNGLNGFFCHQKKNGDLIDVELKSCFIQRGGKRLCLMLVNDITVQRAYLRDIETQNQKLQDLVWRQSHGLRAPLARLQGIVQLLQISGAELCDAQEQNKLLSAIQLASDELDEELLQLVKKTENARIALSLSDPLI